jgi:hypothetical protein
VLYTLSIPVNRYQLAILVKELGTNPWKINTTQWLGKILIGHLERSRRIPHQAQLTGHNFLVELPDSFVKHYGLNYINPENITEFLSAVDRQFRNGLFAYVDKGLLVRTKIGQGKIREMDLTIKDSIREYCAKNGVQEEDIPFDALTKAFYRSRKSSKNSVVLSKEFYSRNLSDAP